MIDNNLIENRHIRVFISSTFQDMQDERDYLMTFTFPKLRRFAAERDVTLTEIDLRWGITEEESKNGKVVEICLKEIDNSIPFFVGIVGNRYGWIPNEYDIFESPNMKDRYNWVFDDIKSNISVTEMEIQYGVLRRKTKINAFFYLKNKKEDKNKIDSPEKLEKFKNAIRRNGRYPVTDYITVQDLDLAVENDFIQLLDELFPQKNSTPLEVERRKQRACINLFKQCYENNSDDLSKIDKFLINDTYNYLTISGEIGTGKSALLANWIMNNEYNSKYRLLYFFTNSQNEINPKCILNYWINELSSYECGVIRELDEEADYKVLKEELENRINSSLQPIIIILDDATVFQEEDNWQINTLDWIPSIKGENKMIISTSVYKSSLSEYRKSEEGIRETNFDITLLSTDVVKTICRKFLKIFGKKLYENQINKIAEFKPTSNARILMTLLNEMVNYGDFESLNKFLESFLDVCTENDFYERYLKHIEDKFGSDLVEKTFMLFAISNYGLKEYEVKDCLNITPLLWSQIYCISAQFFIVRNGCFQIACKEIINAVLKKHGKEISLYRNILIKYLENSLEKTIHKSEQERIWDELAFQYYEQASNNECQDEMAEKLFKLISQPEVIWYLITKRASKLLAFNGEGKQVYKYWTWLFRYDPLNYSLTTYLEPGKFSEEEYLLKSIVFADIALHAKDFIGTAFIVFKTAKIYRMRSNALSEKEIISVEGCMTIMSIIAYTWNLKALSKHLKELADMFSQNQYLPTEETDYEMCLRLIAEAKSNNDTNESMKKFKESLFLLSKIDGDAYSDKAMLNYIIASSLKEINKYNESLTYIESAIQNMELLDEEYDEDNELFEAQLLELKGYVYKELKRYAEAYNTIYETIIKYEDIEDFRIEHGDMNSTIDDVMRLDYELIELQILIDDQEKNHEQ